MTHKCPGPKCAADVEPGMLACPRHWYQVPKPIRRAVWRAWDYGAGAGSAEHQAAMGAAIERMTP